MKEFQNVKAQDLSIYTRKYEQFYKRDPERTFDDAALKQKYKLDGVQCVEGYIGNSKTKNASDSEPAIVKYLALDSQLHRQSECFKDNKTDNTSENCNHYYRKYETFYYSEPVYVDVEQYEMLKMKMRWQKERYESENVEVFRRKYDYFFSGDNTAFYAAKLTRKRNESSISFDKEAPFKIASKFYPKVYNAVAFDFGADALKQTFFEYK